MTGIIITHPLQLICSVTALTFLTFATTSATYHDYCIVGAGPAGLQMGYFLKQANRDYMIFERSNVSGHFFEIFPRHRTLISINKRHTGKTNKEFNLRHDWNSLLSDDESLLFTKYSKEMFPDADVMLKYLGDYREKLGIQVQFNTEVKDVHSVSNQSSPDKTIHSFNDQHGKKYQCKVLVLATGMWKPNIPSIPGMEYVDGYENMNVDPWAYEGKNVLILGHGNSAFEVAQSLYGHTSTIHMAGRSRVRLAWQTHYVGDVRAVNAELLDTYQLKSLDGIKEGDSTIHAIRRTPDGKLEFRTRLVDQDRSYMDKTDNHAWREPYDKIIRCTGFVFDTDVFRNDTELDNGREVEKFIPVEYNYEVKSDAKGIFVAGVASHSVDHRKSAGGFIHGFRYTARALHRLLEWRYEGVPWPSTARGLPVTQLMNVLFKRFNEASGTYQMFQVLGDIVVFSEDGKTFDYYEEFPINLLHKFPESTGHSAYRVLAVVSQYGADWSEPGKDTIGGSRANLNAAKAHTCNFLHPVLYYYEGLPTYKQMKNKERDETLPRPKMIHHVVEDFLTSWDGFKAHATPLRHFLDSILSTDLRSSFAHICFRQSFFVSDPKLSCRDQFYTGQGLTAVSLLSQNVYIDK